MLNDLKMLTIFYTMFLFNLDTFTDSRFSFVVTGNERCRHETQQQLTKLISSIVSEKHKIDKIGVNRVYDDVHVHGKIAEIENETK